MKKNVGNIDRIIRLVGAAIVAVVLFTGAVSLSSTLGIILGVAGVIFAFTGATSWCAIYSLVGASTCPVDTQEG